MAVFLGFTPKILVQTDASSGRAIALRRGVGKLRHLEAKYLWLQQQVELKLLEIVKIKGKDNRVDVGTKHLSAQALELCKKAYGICLLEEVNLQSS